MRGAPLNLIRILYYWYSYWIPWSLYLSFHSLPLMSHDLQKLLTGIQYNILFTLRGSVVIITTIREAQTLHFWSVQRDLWKSVLAHSLFLFWHVATTNTCILLGLCVVYQLRRVCVCFMTGGSTTFLIFYLESGKCVECICKICLSLQNQLEIFGVCHF